MPATPSAIIAPRRQAKQRRSRNKVELILSTTLAMLDEGPADRLTTNAIAKRAGISIGSLYQFFPNKDAILYELFRRWLDQTLEALDAAVQSLDDGDDKEKCVDAVLDALAGEQGINSRGQWQLRRAMGGTAELAELEREHLQQIIQRIVALQAKFGSCPPDGLKTDLALLQNHITIACLHVLSLTAQSDTSADMRECARRVLMFAFDYNALMADPAK